MDNCSFDNEDWFFFNIISSEHSPIKDLNALKWDYTLSEVLDFAEFIDMRGAFERAAHKDEEAKK